MSPRGRGRPAPRQRRGRPAAPGRPAPRPPGQPPAPLPRAPGWTQSLCADPLPVRFWGSFKQLNNPKTGDSRGRLCQQAEEAPASRTPPSEMAPPLESTLSSCCASKSLVILLPSNILPSKFH